MKETTVLPTEIREPLTGPQLEPMPETLTELDSLLEAISDKIPTNQQAPKNQRHARTFQRKMAAYFRQLGAAFPQGKIDDLYRKHVEE